MRSVRILCALLFALAARPALASPLTFEDVWVREAPPNADVMVAYATIKNPSGSMLRIIAVSSEAFDHGELHHMSTQGGVMQMRQVPGFDVAPNRTLKLAPGGDHIMLDHPVKKLKAGDTVKLHFRLSNGETIDVDAGVRKAK